MCECMNVCTLMCVCSCTCHFICESAVEMTFGSVCVCATVSFDFMQGVACERGMPHFRLFNFVQTKRRKMASE